MATDIYGSPDISRASGLTAWLRRNRALSGSVPSSSELDQIIQAELEASRKRMEDSRRFEESKRQFDVNQQNAVDTAEAARKAGIVGSVLQAGTTAGTIRALTMKPGEAFFGGTTAAPATASVPTIAADTSLAPVGAATAGVNTASSTVYPATATGLTTEGAATTAVAPTIGSTALKAVPYIAAYQGARILGDLAGGDSSIAKYPLTGGLRDLGDVTGIKPVREIGRIGTQIEENVIQKPLDFVGNAVDKVIGSIFGGTWICTAIDKMLGLDEGDTPALFKLRKYSIKEHPGWTHWYLDEGKKIVEGMEKAFTPEELKLAYKALKILFIRPVVRLVKEKDMKRAYSHYLAYSQALCKIYAPDVEIKEHKEVR